MATADLVKQAPVEDSKHFWSELDAMDDATPRV